MNNTQQQFYNNIRYFQTTTGEGFLMNNKFEVISRVLKMDIEDIKSCLNYFIEDDIMSFTKNYKNKDGFTGTLIYINDLPKPNYNHKPNYKYEYTYKYDDGCSNNYDQYRSYPKQVQEANNLIKRIIGEK